MIIEQNSYKILKPYQNYLNAEVGKESDNNQQVAKYSKVISGKLEFLILGNKLDHWKQRNSGVEKKDNISN